MNRRSVFLLAAIVAIPALTPASAGPAHVDRSNRDDMGETAARLKDPALQQSLGQAFASLTQAMMDVRVAPFAKAMNGLGDPDADRIDPDATLGDMMAPEDRDLPRQISRDVPAIMSSMGDMADAVQKMKPQFEAIGRQLDKSLPPDEPEE